MVPQRRNRTSPTSTSNLKLRLDPIRSPINPIHNNNPPRMGMGHFDLGSLRFLLYIINSEDEGEGEG